MGREKEDKSPRAMIACQQCDHFFRVEEIEGGGKALCTHCGALLYRSIPNALDRALALNLTALILIIFANIFPFLSLDYMGRVEKNILLTGAIELYRQGMGELGLLVFLTSIFFPLLITCGMLYLLLPRKIGFLAPANGFVYRVINALSSWSLVSVFMLGVLIAMVKLLDFPNTNIIPGVSFYSMLLLMVVTTAARINFDPAILWQDDKAHDDGAINNIAGRAVEHGVMNCHTCGLLTRQRQNQSHHHARCSRCNAPVHQRKQNSLTTTWALVISAAMLLIPANVYPIMTVIRFGQGYPDTIVSGIKHLIEGGMWPLAIIVLFASIIVPILKLGALVLLLLTVRYKSSWRTRDRTLLYRVTEVIGSLSMIDIFLIAILTALVQLDALSTIRPGVGATFFAAVVILTMIAAHSFDPRLIWDNAEQRND